MQQLGLEQAHLPRQILQRLAPRQASAFPAVVVDIDEDSLRAHGQWPWPRTLIGELVTKLMRSGAVVVGFDVLFAEPDRLSPAKLSSALRAQLPLVIEALPRLAEQSLLRAERADEIGTSARLAQLERQLAEGQRRTRRTVVAATFTLLTVALGWMLSQDVALPGGSGAVWLSAGLAAWSWWRAR